YMIREAVQLNKNGPYFSAIGNFAELGYPTFRWQAAWTTTLRTGNWTHSGVINMRSGYLDQEVTAEVLDGAGNVTGTEDIRVKVPEHLTFDWQSSWALRKDMQLTVGAINVFDTKPPLSISNGGLGRGQQFGFDDRFYDSRGRMFYANFSYKF
ncbi:MAG: TonB-dependent receptor, partial [Pseudomonadota bacterium]